MPIRLIQDPALDGPANMARDEALLARVGRGESPPTLRLYQWDPPTISLGYFQRFEDYLALPPPAGELAVVRRTTGGGAILHDLELTYSIALPLGHPLLADGYSRLYELAHDAVIASLAEANYASNRCGLSDGSSAGRGPFFCFERRHCLDVLINDDKVAGSAQRRTQRAVLQHGSIILGNRYPQQKTAKLDVSFENAIEAMRLAFPRHFAAGAEVKFEEASWTAEELAEADQIRPKYAGNEWTRRT